MDIANERSYPTPYANSPLLPMLLMSLAMQKHSPDTETTFKNEYDYIIVGAGSAGAVVASRLSEIPCVSVLLLEAGKAPPSLTDIPALARNFYGTDIDWQHKTTRQRHTGRGLVNRQVPWPAGKTLGGTSTVNGLLFIRGNRRNYDEWAELGAEGWSFKDVLPYLKKLEDNTDADDSDLRATGGPVTASKPAYNPITKTAEIQAAENEGYEFVDSNAEEQVGFYDPQATLRRGQRCGTAKAYLVPAENRTNLDIIPMATVTKIIIEDKVAVGVEFMASNGSVYEVRAKREVIVSAGVVKTAQLLMLSGIGPENELLKHDITPVADLPVGRNMMDHAASFIFYELDDSIKSFDEEIQTEANIQEYINNRTGPLTSLEGFTVMSFLNNPDINADSMIPDYTIYFVDFVKLVINQVGLTDEFYERVAEPYANKTLVYCVSQLLRPYSRGTVTLQSKDPMDPPLIDPDYLHDVRDIENLVKGFKTCQQVLNNKAMEQVGAKRPTVLIPGCELLVFFEDLYLRCLVKSIIATTGHHAGTARMGDLKDPRTVVDPQLKVKGIKHLRVVDASIMPTITWGSTNIPTIMIAEKASDMIKKNINCDNSDE